MIGIILREASKVNLIWLNKMKNLKELAKDDLLVLNGGESFAYRIGQAMAILYDLTFDGSPGRLDTFGGINALNNWFGY